MTEKRISLAGCHPPIATPFNEDGKVALDELARNLEAWQETPLAGFAVLGSNGEFVFLDDQEKTAILKLAGEVIRPPRLFIAGTGCEATRDTVSLTEAAARCGAHAALVVTPHYYKGRMTHGALVEYFTSVADRSPIPIILYNVPGFTGVDMAAETLGELAHHPNIAGLKESSGNVVKMGQVAALAPQGFQILAGSGSFLLPALAMGAVGGIMALASVAAFPLEEILKAFHEGDLGRARATQIRLIEANAAVTTRFGIPGLKAAMDMAGLYGGPVRPPLLPLTHNEREAVRAVLRKAALLP
jgi:4-hydroxy-2-oxoglutarate aldolase